MLTKKVLLRFVAFYSVAFTLVYVIPEHIHRRDFDKAFTTWLHERTPQHEATLEVERRKNEMIHIEDCAVIALGFVVLGSGIYYVPRLARRKRDGQGTSTHKEDGREIRVGPKRKLARSTSI